MEEAQPLREVEEAQPLTGMSPEKRLHLLKYASLLMIVFQNPSHQIMLRLSRVATPPCSAYHVSEVVLYSEFLKACVCFFTYILCENGTAGGVLRQLWHGDMWKLAVPAGCFTLQNNLQFVASSYVGPETLQLVYQTKTLTTAMLGMCILNRSLKFSQWLALCTLVVGIVTSQYNPDKPWTRVKRSDDAMAFGVSIAVCISLLSGFASVYLEKILKGDDTSLWMRNMQLCVFSIPLQFWVVWRNDFDSIRQTRGWGHGMCPLTVGVVAQFGLGGLLSAMIMRFADNNLKNLALALSIILTCFISIPLFGFEPTGYFGLGCIMVIASIFLYAQAPACSCTTS